MPDQLSERCADNAVVGSLKVNGSFGATRRRNEREDQRPVEGSKLSNSKVIFPLASNFWIVSPLRTTVRHR